MDILSLLSKLTALQGKLTWVLAPKLTKLLEGSAYIYIQVDPRTPPSNELPHINLSWRL